MERIDNIEKYIQEKSGYSKDVFELNDMQDCPLPIDTEVDLSVMEDKTLGDKIFQYNLVCNTFNF